jgi:hypothetical protein
VCLAELPDHSGRLEINNTIEIRSIKEIYNFCRASVVGVPVVTKVTNTLVQWLCWMVSSYAGLLDTKMTSLRSACLHTWVLQYLGMLMALPT